MLHATSFLSGRTVERKSCKADADNSVCEIAANCRRRRCVTSLLAYHFHQTRVREGILELMPRTGCAHPRNTGAHSKVRARILVALMTGNAHAKSDDLSWMCLPRQCLNGAKSCHAASVCLRGRHALSWSCHCTTLLSTGKRREVQFARPYVACLCSSVYLPVKQSVCETKYM